MPNSPNLAQGRRPRIAVVGVGGYAQIYLGLVNAAREEGRLSITAATVIARDQHLPAVETLRQQGVRIYGGYAEMLAEEAGNIDLCLIPTGIQWHARMSIAALNAGANVLVEKPLAGCLADARAIQAAEAANDRWVAVGFQDLYVPEVAWMKKQLCDGRIGRITSVTMIGLWPRSRGYFERNQWAGRLFADGAAAMDSPLNNALAHFANVSLFLAGPTPDTSADVTVTGAELFRAHTIESFDTAVIRARSANGIDFWFGVSHACKTNREPEIRLEGTAGRAEWLHSRDLAIIPDDGPEERIPVPNYTCTRQAMFDAVLARMKDRSVRICDTSIAICHTRLVEGIHREGVIATVAPSQIEWCEASGDDSTVPAIVGIENMLCQAHAERTSLAESGFGIPLQATP